MLLATEYLQDQTAHPQGRTAHPLGQTVHPQGQKAVQYLKLYLCN